MTLGIPTGSSLAIILAVCLVGAYSPRNTMFDVWIALIFGVLGFAVKKKQSVKVLRRVPRVLLTEEDKL